jgi:hypothetical protein
MKMKHVASRLLTRQDSYDSARLSQYVRTAMVAIVSKPQSHFQVFISLTGLEWT